MNQNNFKPETCEHCGQTKTYALAIDRGTTEILKAIARFIGQKGINAVHPRKEMEGKFLTSNQVGNLSRPRLHGLIARIESGNYCLTTKGANFLKGVVVPKVAIILKATGKSEKRNIGYYEPTELICQISDFTSDTERWEGINYTIEEGRIIREIGSSGQDNLSI